MSDEATAIGQFRAAWGLPDIPVTAAAPVDVAALIRAQRMERFREFCPAEFRKAIDRALLPNLTAWDAADTWAGEFPGIWLWSEATGRGKSRMLWRKFGQFHVDRGLAVMRVTGQHLVEDYADARRIGRASGFYQKFGRLDVVMLDDLDKMDLPAGADGSESYGERDRGMRNALVLRELFDVFYEQHVPLLVTANEPIAWFAERIGASAERRMRACCREIEF